MPYMKKQTQVTVKQLLLQKSYNLPQISVDIENSDGEEQWHRRGHDHPQQDHGPGGTHQAMAAYQNLREADMGECE